MPRTLLVLSTLTPTPDLTASPFGPFIVTPCTDAADVQRQSEQQHVDALLLGASDPGAAPWAQWPGLARAVADAAVLLIAPEPQAAVAVRWIQLGLQDVLATREATPERLGRAIRLAVERKRLSLDARRAYATDLATGLASQAQLMDHMTHLLALREREPAAMALVALRVDGLGSAEARLGVEGANVVRREIAVRLRAAVRASDVVAATGPDSFAVLLAWIDDAADGDRVAAKLLQHLQRPYTVAGHPLGVVMHAGVSRYPEQGRDAESLMQAASSRSNAA